MAFAMPQEKEKEKQNIKVMVRVRPMNKIETEMQVRNIVKCVSSEVLMIKDKKFRFDAVFKSETGQLQVYKSMVAPMIPDVIAGYNCTVFAYGQTGSGKTYTMTGNNCQCLSNWRDDPDAGCIPRAVSHIFETLRLEKNENNVTVSYLELYNEEVRDLLSNDESLLAVYNDTKGSIFIQGLSEISVRDTEGLCKQLQTGILKRQTAPTLMNHLSSRSHTVFTITVHTRESTISGEDILKIGKLNLVDLAGSENIARSGCRDVRALELANINKSLLTLGRVIYALADKGQRHVPYRDSKLTRILQDSLGGHTKTCIVATISPAATAYEDTINTLEYASRARDIKNTPTVNEKLTRAQMMQGLTNEIERLQRDLDAARDKSGFFVNEDNYRKLLDSIEIVTGEKMTMEEHTRQQAKRIHELEEIVRTRTKEFDDTVYMCKKNKELLNKAKKVIKEKKANLKQEQFVAQIYQMEANQLQIQAEQLLSKTKLLSVERGILQDKLQNQCNINITNQTTSQRVISQVLEELNEISVEGEKVKLSVDKWRKLYKEDLNDLKMELQRPFEEVKKLLKFFNAHHLEELSISDEMNDAVNVHIGIIRERTFEIKSKMAMLLDELNKFAAGKIGTVIEEFQIIVNNYKCAVRDLVEKMHDTLADRDTCLKESIIQLEKTISAQKEYEQIMFEKKLQLDNKILNRIKSIKDQFLDKNYEERGQQLLHDLIELTETSACEVKAVIENSERTVISDHTLTVSIESATDEVLTSLTQLDQEMKSLWARFDESKHQSQFLGETLATQMEEASGVADTKINIIDSRLDFLMDERDTFQKMFENYEQKTRHTLREGFLEKFVLVKHEGDTPARKTVVLTKSLGSLAPREALIEKFKQEAALFSDEDKENLDELYQLQ